MGMTQQPEHTPGPQPAHGVIETMPAGNRVLCNVTFGTSWGCGCQLEGIGTLPEPFEVVRCPVHRAAPALLEAAEDAYDLIDAIAATTDRPQACVRVVDALRAAIQQAREAQS